MQTNVVAESQTLYSTIAIQKPIIDTFALGKLRLEDIPCP